MAVHSLVRAQTGAGTLAAAKSAFTTATGRVVPIAVSWLSARPIVAIEPCDAALCIVRSALTWLRLSTAKPMAEHADQLKQPIHRTVPAMAKLRWRRVQRSRTNSGSAAFPRTPLLSIPTFGNHYIFCQTAVELSCCCDTAHHALYSHVAADEVGY